MSTLLYPSFRNDESFKDPARVTSHTWLVELRNVVVPNLKMSKGC
jgi:hypothetical protein